MNKLLKFIFLLTLFICLVGCSNKKVNITFYNEENMNTIEVNYKTVVTNDFISWIDNDNIEGLYLDNNYTIKYNNEKIKEDINIYIKTKEVKVTFKYEDKEEVVNIKRLSNISYDLITIIDKDNIEGLYLDSNYTIKYNNEDVKEDINIYILSYDQTYNVIINQYVKTKQLENSNLIEYYQIGVFKGYNIGVWKKTTDNFSVYQETFGDIVITLGINCELLGWKSGEFYNLKELYNLNIITNEMILDIESYFTRDIDANLSPIKTSGLNVAENKIISTYEEFYEIFYSDEEQRKFYIEKGFVYDEEFFKTKSLVFAYFTHNVMGNYVDLQNASIDNNNLYINMLISSGAMDGFFHGHLVVEVYKKDIFNINNIILNKIVVDEEKFNITFIIDGKEEVNTIKMLQIVTKEMIHSIDYNTVEGLYLDSNYTIPYDYYNIKEDTVIYVKLK